MKRLLDTKNLLEVALTGYQICEFKFNAKKTYYESKYPGRYVLICWLFNDPSNVREYVFFTKSAVDRFIQVYLESINSYFVRRVKCSPHLVSNYVEGYIGAVSSEVKQTIKTFNTLQADIAKITREMDRKMHKINSLMDEMQMFLKSDEFLM
jgi:hypothetical protein